MVFNKATYSFSPAFFVISTLLEIVVDVKDTTKKQANQKDSIEHSELCQE